MKAAANCTAERGQPGYCPVVTVGGSYPGFLSAMMRLRYPAVVDMVCRRPRCWLSRCLALLLASTPPP